MGIGTGAYCKAPQRPCAGRTAALSPHPATCLAETLTPAMRPAQDLLEDRDMRQHRNTNRSAASTDPTGLGLLPGDMQQPALHDAPVPHGDADPLADGLPDSRGMIQRTAALLTQFPEPDHSGPAGTYLPPELMRLDGRCARQQAAQPGPFRQVDAPSPDDMQAALAALVQLLRTIPIVHAVAPRRRVKASPKQITETMALIQQCGLTPTGIVHRADGSTAVEIGNPPAPEPRKPRGWDI